jgi:hypothetical protein
MSYRQLNAFVDILMKTYPKGGIFDVTGGLQKNSTLDKDFFSCYKACKKIGEYRLPMFVAMQTEEQVRVLLHQMDTTQGNIMILIIIKKLNM